MTLPVDGYLPLAAVIAAAIIAKATRAVSVSGALAGAGLGIAISLGTGWSGFAMLAALLVVGTLASSRRDRSALQALCNGSVAAACALAAGFGVEWGAVATAGALSTALSDTFAGETGQRHGGAPRLLLFGRRVKPGADGGMTWFGTAAAIPAAALVPVVGRLDVTSIAVVTIAGVAGNLVDSLLGVLVQPRIGSRGNDWVNLLATAAGAAIAVALSR